MSYFKALSVAILCALTVASASVTPLEARSNLSARSCTANTPHAVEFLRASNPSDHFYTTSTTELNAAIVSGYVFDGDAGRIYSTAIDSTVVPFYRAYNPTTVDHFYTTSATELEAAISNLGYVSQGTAGYIYPTQICGSLPLYRLVSTVLTDHFYTLSSAEVTSAELGSGDYIYEGIAGYILAA